MTATDSETAVERAREFAQCVVAPAAADLDAHPDPERCFSWELVERGDRLGLRTLTLGREHGGSGLGLGTLARVIFEIACADAGVAAVFAQTNKLWQVLEGAANPGQLAWLIPRFRADPRCLLAVAITEPDVGSDYIIPIQGPGAPRFTTSARRRDGGWELEGYKHFIDNGNRAGIYLLMAQTDPLVGLAEGTTCFVAEAGTPGLRPGKVFDKLGERLANHTQVFIESCFLPDSQVLGNVNRGFELLHRHFAGRATLAACSVLGVAESAYCLALEWSLGDPQEAGRRRPCDVLGIQLAEMRMILNAARDHVLNTASRIEAGTAGVNDDALAKVYASRAAHEVLTHALELASREDMCRGAGLEKLLRDCASFFHSDGVNRTLLIKAGRAIQMA